MNLKLYFYSYFFLLLTLELFVLFKLLTTPLKINSVKLEVLKGKKKKQKKKKKKKWLFLEDEL